MKMEKAREDRIRSAVMFDETCNICGEDRLVWKLDTKDGKVKLWQPYHFHICDKPLEKENKI